ncbi:hypothetical protein E5676_scaffold108G001070 [Cucumis melo var. makuwa]|uniref:DNA-directed RNA polymerase I subunit RPA1-like n=1 Tax=Cucumis melo var. makuwa TaxID=1194695 RepID=A0A5D3C0F5_CUCMM|nr:hypothetical protein E5676_scaffold108G001070 [Cucumis melo var. makuwa]
MGTRLICASLGSTRLICASFGSTRLICASFGSTRLICAFYGTTRLLCRVRAQRGADRREAGRMREGHMDASGFLIASAMYFVRIFESQVTYVMLTRANPRSGQVVNMARRCWIFQVTRVILVRANPRSARGDSYVSEWACCEMIPVYDIVALAIRKMLMRCRWSVTYRREQIPGQRWEIFKSHNDLAIVIVIQLPKVVEGERGKEEKDKLHASKHLLRGGN